MRNHQSFPLLSGGALLLMLAVPTLAQSQPRGPRDGVRRGPERGPRAKGELNRIWRGIAGLEGSKLALSKAQSARVVALVLPVSRQKSLSDASAKALATRISAVLTAAQRAQLEKTHPRGPRGNRPPNGPMGGPPPRNDNDNDKNGPRGDGPPPRRNGAEFEKVRPFMDALNPFYAPTGYAQFKSLPADFARDVIKRYSERRALLEKLSKRAKSK